MSIGAASCGLLILTAKRDELVFRILPGDRGHIGLLGRAQLEEIGAPVGVDDEVGGDVRPGRLHEDVDLPRGARAALGVADDPAHRVARGDGARAHELLALLQRDVGDFARRGVDLIERAGRERINLDGVDEAVSHRLHARGGVGLIDAHRRIGRLGDRLAVPERLQLPGERQGLGQLDDSHGQRRVAHEFRQHAVVIVDVGRDELVGAASRAPSRQSAKPPFRIRGKA